MKLGLLPTLLLLLVLAGCAAGATGSSSSQSTPRVRCLSDPRERDTRPLFFFFCIESP